MMKEIQKNNPLVSIIIPNWNGKQYLKTLLDSLFEQDYKNLEVILVDCASSDGSSKFVKENYPEVKLIELKEDKGPTNALNVGIRASKGEYILLLNNDVILPSDCVGILVNELKEDENVVMSPLEFNWEKVYWRGGGSFSFFHGFLYQFFNLHPSIPLSPFWPLSACCITTKKILNLNPLNENLFMYEEMEWGWRLHLKRIAVKVSTKTKYFHKLEGTSKRGSPKQAFFYSQGMIATCFICLRLTSFLLLSPLISLWYLRNLGAYLKNGWWNSFFAFLKGFFSFFRKIKIFLKDREKVQKERLVGDWEIIKIMDGSLIFQKILKEKSIKKYA